MSKATRGANEMKKWTKQSEQCHFAMFNVLRYSTDPSTKSLKSIQMFQSFGVVMSCIEEWRTNWVVIGTRKLLSCWLYFAPIPMTMHFKRSKQLSIFSRFRPQEIIVMLVVFRTYSHDNAFRGWTKFRSKTSESGSIHRKSWLSLVDLLLRCLACTRFWRTPCVLRAESSTRLRSLACARINLARPLAESSTRPPSAVHSVKRVQ